MKEFYVVKEIESYEDVLELNKRILLQSTKGEIINPIFKIKKNYEEESLANYYIKIEESK